MAKKARLSTNVSTNKPVMNTDNHRSNTLYDTPPTRRRASFSRAVDWPEAVADFLLQTRATREESTERFYRERLRLLVRWAQAKGIALADFRARDLREYLASRADQKVSDLTRRHDASVARTFLKFCKREDYVQGDPLAGYQVPKAERAYVKCPSDDEIRTLLRALQDRWKPSLNPSARYVHASARQFFSRRNYTIVAGLLETGARIGEMLALTLDDYQPQQQQIAIRHSKGDAPRIVPISQVWIETVEVYLRVRPKVECDLLFVSEFGEKMEVLRFGRQFKGYLKFAGLSGFTLHGLRHYAITQMAKTDVWAASLIAGHKNLFQNYLEPPKADEGAPQSQERLMNIRPPLIPHFQPPKLVHPSVRALHNPAVTAQPLTAFYTATGNARDDKARFQSLPQSLAVIRLVRMQFVGTMSQTLPNTQGRQGIYQRQKMLAVGGIGPCEHSDQRQAVPVYHKMAFRALFASIRRVGAAGSAPFGAGTLEESTLTRLQLIRSAICSRSRSR